jgi:hypothetical protein
MQIKSSSLTNLLKFGLCAVLALGFLAQAQAEDKKGDPAGTWTWSTPGRNGGPERKFTLKLKVEGEKLTGKIITPGRDGKDNETEIGEGKVKDGEVSFTVTREFNGNKMVSKYSGKVGADAIKGKIEFERNGDKQSRDWEAKRATEKKD